MLPAVHVRLAQPIARWTCVRTLATSSNGDAKEAATGGDGAAAAADAAGELAAARAAADAARADADKWKKELQYALADRENMRTILKRDIENAKSFGITAFAEDMLLVHDDFGRALTSVTAAELAANEQLRRLHEGTFVRRARVRAWGVCVCMLSQHYCWRVGMIIRSLCCC